MSNSAPDIESQPTNPEGIDRSTDAEYLDKLLSEIGMARFASRISAGIIGEMAGYEAIARVVRADKHRPLFSKLTQALLRRPNSYEVDE